MFREMVSETSKQEIVCTSCVNEREGGGGEEEKERERED